MIKCVCCNISDDEAPDVLTQDPSGEWWCQPCVSFCIQARKDIEEGNYVLEEGQ